MAAGLGYTLLIPRSATFTFVTDRLRTKSGQGKRRGNFPWLSSCLQLAHTSLCGSATFTFVTDRLRTKLGQGKRRGIFPWLSSCQFLIPRSATSTFVTDRLQKLRTKPDQGKKRGIFPWQQQSTSLYDSYISFAQSTCFVSIYINGYISACLPPTPHQTPSPRPKIFYLAHFLSHLSF